MDNFKGDFFLSIIFIFGTLLLKIQDFQKSIMSAKHCPKNWPLCNGFVVQGHIILSLMNYQYMTIKEVAYLLFFFFPHRRIVITPYKIAN